jgi:hypothetical protein
MRNGQNKRMRGRHQHHHHRKNQNPLTRVYESNGPEVKIRGTASHVAEKYVQLARDAMASGDPVTAENYHQHAEHYFRLIAAAQEQFRQQNPYYRPEGEASDDNRDDAFDDGDELSNQPQPMQGQPMQGGQPNYGGQQQPYPAREPQPYGNREPQHQQHRPQHHQNSQHNQYNQHHNQQHQPQHNPQPHQPNVDTENTDRLPSFITGGNQQQPNFNPNTNYDNNNQGGGGGYQMHRRRRRHRGHHRHDMPQGAGAEMPDDSRADND